MSKHEKVLRAVFEEPAPANLHWSDVEALLVWLGAEITEGSGSRVRVHLKGIRAVFHRPHPRKEAGRLLVRDVRRLLETAEVRP